MEDQRMAVIRCFARIPLAGHEDGVDEALLTENPFGDPHTIQLVLKAGRETKAWCILPKDWFNPELVKDDR